MDNKTTLVKNWLIKAIHDLAVSKKLKADEEQYLDVAIYHCQQAAEKAIKGFLVLHDKAFPKTHDLRLLVQLAVSVNSEFVKYEDAADVLTPYATEFRYPGDIMDPTDEEMDQGIKNAEEILHYVISLLTDDLQKILSKE
jgi:HEPN domain-containing protein